MGHAAGAPLLATALHRRLLTAGVSGGWGERDISAIIAVLRSLVAPPGGNRPPAAEPGQV